MSVTGFFIDRTAQGVEDLIQQIRGVSGTQYSEGDACLISTSTGGSTGGLLIQAATQTAQPQYVFLSEVTPASVLRPATYNLLTSAYEMCEVIPVAGTNIVLATQFPLATFDGTATNSNSTANQIVFTGAGSTDDLTGGQVYVNELNAQFYIIKDTVSAGAHTLTVAPAPRVTVSTGYTIRAVPWGPGYVGGVKLQSSNPQQGISVAVADKTGGHLIIHSVNLALRTAYVRFSTVNP